MSLLSLGVDGCKAGWITVSILDFKKHNIEIFSNIFELWKSYSHADIILIDIPIGLRDHGEIPRLCDIAARKYLTRKRSSCIFPTPCRKALNASNYIQVNEINRKMTGKGLSKQMWNIIPKIKEVDALLQNNALSRKIFIESQPELCYTGLNRDKPMEFYKKTYNGIMERLRLLKSYWRISNTPLEKGLKKYKRSETLIDDILDAWVLAISAARGLSYLRMIPENYKYDSTGLPMRMAVPTFKNL